MKTDNLEFLEQNKIKEIENKHSKLIYFEISYMVEKTTKKEISDDNESEINEGEKFEYKDKKDENI